MPRRFLDPALFNDERLAKATIEERLLFTAVIANQDDDGRLLAHPGYLRSVAFPYDDYTIKQISEMRDHLAQVNHNFIVYEIDGHEYIQLKRYHRYQRPRYYHASKFPAPPGWPFEDNTQDEKEQQPPSNQEDTAQLPSGNREDTAQYTEGRDRVRIGMGIDNTMIGKGEESEKGSITKTEKNSPSPSPAALPKSFKVSQPTNLDIATEKILQRLNICFKESWATHIPGTPLSKFNPRKPTAKEHAQLRDLAIELSAAGGCPLDNINQAFEEAAVASKMHISYVRAILLDWLGVSRDKTEPDGSSASPATARAP